MKPLFKVALIAGVPLGTLQATGACGAPPCEDWDACGTYQPPPSADGGSSSGEAGESGAAGQADRGGANGRGGSSLGGAGNQAGALNTGGEAGGDRGGSTATGGAAGMSGAGTAGGEGGDAGSGAQPCDPASTPGEDACVIGEEYGVFVSPTGDDEGGNGSRDNPFATLRKAIGEAIASDKRVYACDDGSSYEESVTLDAEAGRLALFGGFSCSDWTYDTTARSEVSSSTALALRIEHASDVRIEDFRFVAADGIAPGESSVGAFVADSTDVVFMRVEIEAGDGADGSDGTLEAFAYPAQAALNGNSESAPGVGGGEKVCLCQGTLLTSGGGGGPPNGAGQAGGKGLPDHDGDQGNLGDGGTPAGCGLGGTGIDGSDAPHAPTAAGAATYGSASRSGWVPASGEDGATGQPGQGGGGGASRNSSGHGGGGGCGGCGGNGGGAGGGGGASIALLVVDSTVDISASRLVSADAAKGGDGHTGQAGQQESGLGGQVLSTFNSCPGGNGANGGNGGAGGGGAGGISVGILWFGDAAPTQFELAFVTGAAGDGGVGGDAGNNDGIDGVAQPILEAQ